jgi:glutathionylspermidine synthase
VRRQTQPRRPDWVQKIESVGLTYHRLGATAADGVYWDESVAYAFSMAEVERIEAATAELHRLCLAAVEHVVSQPDLMARFAIAPEFQDYVRRSWARRDPHVYGRFDLAFDPGNPRLAEPKLLEANYDTPTLLVETAVVQWFWLEEVFPKADQFNSVHERLIERWRQIGALMGGERRLHLSALDTMLEEVQTVTYLEDTARQAGLETTYIPLDKVGWDADRHLFIDEAQRPIQYWFKLYPWEWIATDTFGPNLLEDSVGVIEPAWKMLLSNKAILPVLWELFPDHPNLLPAYLDPAPLGERSIAKPILGREGANMEMRLPGQSPVRTGGTYGEGPFIYQEAVDLPRFEGAYAVIGSWTVADEPAGMILREDDTRIVTNASKVVPHFIEG